MNLANLNIGKVKDLARKGIDKARQYAEGLNELEVKVEEATNLDKWGPHGALMQEITKHSYQPEEYKQILAVLARRLHSEPKQWRQVYKSLLLLEYMAKNGPDTMVKELKSNGKVFNRLQTFEYTDSEGRDQGINVRNRAKQLWTLINDDLAIQAEREKADKTRGKYGGIDNHGFQVSTTIPSFPASSTGDSLGASMGASIGGTARLAPVDPVMATEQRIAQLPISDDHFGEERVSSGSTGRPAPEAAAAAPRKPKLSEIQADSQIAATLMKNFPGAKGAAGSGSVVSGSAAAGQSLLDLGDDSSAAPARAGAGAAGNADWADFSAPAAAAPAPAEPMYADPFAAAMAAPAPEEAADPFGNFAAPPGEAPAAAATKAASPIKGRAALPLDMFGAPAPPAWGTGGMPGVATGGAARPQGMMMPMMGTPAGMGASSDAQMRTLNGAAAKQSSTADPFADLLG